MRKQNDCYAQLGLVRHDVLSGRRSVAGNHERIEQHVVAKDHDRESEQTAPAGNFCGSALRIVDLINSHLIYSYSTVITSLPVFPVRSPCSAVRPFKK